MTRRTLLALCGIAIAPVSALARVQKSDDPVSGSWGPDGQRLLDLKYDGKETVTGSTFWVSNNDSVKLAIKKGTFNRKTAALRLEGEGAPPGTADTVQYVIEGTLQGSTLEGTYTFGTHKGNFSFKKQ
jgi:hypothetical protein